MKIKFVLTFLARTKQSFQTDSVCSGFVVFEERDRKVLKFDLNSSILVKF